MKDDNIKSLLLTENDKLDIPLSQKVLNVPIEQKSKVVSNSYTRYKSIKFLFPAVCCLLIICCACLCVFNYTNTQTTLNLTSYILEINPSICITTDSDDKVLNVCSLNADADEILDDEYFSDINGMDFSICINKVVDIVAQKGFLNNYHNTIKLYAINDSQEKLSKKLCDFENTFKNSLNNLNYGYISVEKHEMNMTEFKGKVGFTNDFNRLNDMGDFFRQHDRFFNMPH